MCLIDYDVFISDVFSLLGIRCLSDFPLWVALDGKHVYVHRRCPGINLLHVKWSRHGQDPVWKPPFYTVRSNLEQGTALSPQGHSLRMRKGTGQSKMESLVTTTRSPLIKWGMEMVNFNISQHAWSEVTWHRFPTSSGFLFWLWCRAM